MPTTTPRPTSWSELIGLAGVRILTGVIVMLYFNMPSAGTSPSGVTTSGAVGTELAGAVDRPKGAVPVRWRDTNERKRWSAYR
jgi:hypothetical protein